MIQNRLMTEDELAVVLGWATDEGWNPGLEDAAAFWAADPEGFFVAEAEGAPVAAISVVRHTPNFAFLGLYLCLPAYRGKGIGFDLWRYALEHAGPRCVGLDGVPEQEENYRASGFVAAGVTTRFTGVLPGGDGAGVRPASPEDHTQLVAMEAAASGVAKPQYLGAWFEKADTRQTMMLEEGGRVAGFATLRACQSGFKVGPLVTENAAAAKRLLGAIAAEVGGAEVSIDVPEASTALRGTVEAMGLEAGFATARMYKGVPPEAGDAVYAVTSLELG